MNISKFKTGLKEYLTFTKGEQIGIIALIVLILIIVTVTHFLPYFFCPDSRFDVSSFQKEMEAFERSSIVNDTNPGHRNTVTYTKKHPVSDKVPLLDINSADSSMFEKLPGIGQVLSKRIVKYRNLLGGFYSAEQLQEVYGIKPEVWVKIKKKLTVDASKIIKLNINTAEFRLINSHPYISFEQTKSIFKLRNRGGIMNLQALRNEGIFTDPELDKLSNYLVF